MNVQIINYTKKGKQGTYTYSPFSSPRSLDEFELNIIDLGDEAIWFDDRGMLQSVNIQNDFVSVGRMVSNSSRSSILYVLPQDILFHHAVGHTIKNDGSTTIQYATKRIKDLLDSIQKHVLPSIIPGYNMPLIYENTVSHVGQFDFNAAFFFSGLAQEIVRSTGGRKATMIKRSENVFLTTLDILSSPEKTADFISNLFCKESKQEKPSWIKGYCFDDDSVQKEIIEQNEKIIKEAKIKIEDANRVLEKNDRYKSVLYTNGAELVEVVFSILEKLFDYDLSGFVDEKKQDFLIVKENYTIIGEIKGISTNVKRAHISQLYDHYNNYQDKLDEEGRAEHVYQALIINPLLQKPLDERDEINKERIDQAKSYGSLIIETKTLLKLFELYLEGKITTADCEALFTSQKGLLVESDFINGVNGANQ